MYDRKKIERTFYKFMKSQGGDLLNRFLYNHCVHHHMNIPKSSDKKLAFKAVLDDCFNKAFGYCNIVNQTQMMNIIGNVSSAFIWSETPEGNAFWYDLHERWCYYVNGNKEKLTVWK